MENNPCSAANSAGWRKPRLFTDGAGAERISEASGEKRLFHLQSFLIVVIILFHGPLVSPENMRIPEGIQRKDE